MSPPWHNVLSLFLDAKHSCSLLQVLAGLADAWPWAYHSFDIKSLTLAPWGLRALQVTQSFPWGANFNSSLLPPRQQDFALRCVRGLQYLILRSVSFPGTGPGPLGDIGWVLTLHHTFLK